MKSSCRNGLDASSGLSAGVVSGWLSGRTGASEGLLSGHSGCRIGEAVKMGSAVCTRNTSFALLDRLQLFDNTSRARTIGAISCSCGAAEPLASPSIYGTSTNAPSTFPERSISSAAFASSRGIGVTRVSIGHRAASARNSVPSARVRLATDWIERSSQRSA